MSGILPLGACVVAAQITAPANPSALAASVAELHQLLNCYECELTPSQAEAISLVLHELSRLQVAQLAAPTLPNWKAFALAVLENSREYLGSDVDGALVQDAASEHGLLDDTEVSESCGENCACAEIGAFPTSCYRYSPAVIKAIAAQGEAK